MDGGRDAVFRNVYSLVEASARSGGALRGSGMWLLVTRTATTDDPEFNVSPTSSVFRVIQCAPLLDSGRKPEGEGRAHHVWNSRRG